MPYTVRLRLSDPAGRTPKGVLVEQRMSGGFVKLGEIADSDRVRVTTQDTVDPIHHLRVTVEWSDGLISVSDDVFVSADKKILIQPDPSIDAPRHTLPAMSLISDAANMTAGVRAPLNVYGLEPLPRVEYGLGAVILGFLGGALTVALWILGRGPVRHSDG